MSIQAMKQALKALELAYTPLAEDRQEVLKAVKALHTAIAEATRYGGQQEEKATYPIWVGLTARDLAEIPPSAFEGAIWADAKLREKNS